MKYQDFIFDLYGTLVDIHTDEEKPELWRLFAAELSRYDIDYHPRDLQVDYQALVAAEEAKLRQLHPDAADYYPEIRIDDVLCHLFAEKGLSVDEEAILRLGQTFRQLSREYLRLYDGAAILLTDLRKAGGRVWLLSNAQRLFTQPELEQLGLTDCFDGIFLSSDYGVKKPDARFFRALLDAKGILPERAIMIGNDGTCDIGGAKAAGLASMYIRSNLSPKEPVPKADYILRNMDIPKVYRILLGKPFPKTAAAAEADGELLEGKKTENDV